MGSFWVLLVFLLDDAWEASQALDVLAQTLGNATFFGDLLLALVHVLALHGANLFAVTHAGFLPRFLAGVPSFFKP